MREIKWFLKGDIIFRNNRLEVVYKKRVLQAPLFEYLFEKTGGWRLATLLQDIAA